MQPEESSVGQDYKDESGKIVPMKKRETTGITLMKLDANHRVMARYRVNGDRAGSIVRWFKSLHWK